MMAGEATVAIPRLIVDGFTVSFSTDEGQISYASVDTDENGKAEITLSSGTDKSNRTATITAEVTGLSSVQIPIQITGTTISLSTDRTNIAVDESATLSILVQGADGFPESRAGKYGHFVPGYR